MNFKLLSLLFIFGLLVVTTTDKVFADHGSGGGGGCSGDCTPPTLGQDNTGRVYVKDGLTINGNGFDVSSFQQNLPAQTFKVNEPTKITLKIYENTGPSFLTNVFLIFGLEEEIISGVKVQTHPIQIIWETPFDGEPFFLVEDPLGLISDVSVDTNLGKDAFGNEDTTTEINFEFTPVQKFDTNTMLVKVWDYKNNSWTNHFNGPIIFDDSESKLSENNNLFGTGESSSKIPNWFKNNAGYWAQNQIDDQTFVMGIKYLIEEKIIHIVDLEKFQPEPLLHFIDMKKGAQHYIDRYYQDDVYQDWFDTNFPEYTIEEAVGVPQNPIIPDWIKNNAKLWTEGMISDKDFLNGIEFLINKGIILF